jgi:hypothetical protein
MIKVTDEDRQRFHELMRLNATTRGTEAVRAIRRELIAIINHYPKGHRIKAHLQLMRSE